MRRASACKRDVSNERAETRLIVESWLFPCVEFRIGRFGRRESDLIIQDSVDGNILQMTDRVMEIVKAKYLTSLFYRRRA